MSAGEDICAVSDCGRPVVARGLCQTHLKRLGATGKVGGPIMAMRPRRKDTVKVSGRSLARYCADTLHRYAAEHGVSVNAVMTDILEAWARRQRRKRK